MGNPERKGGCWAARRTLPGGNEHHALRFGRFLTTFGNFRRCDGGCIVSEAGPDIGEDTRDFFIVQVILSGHDSLAGASINEGNTHLPVRHNIDQWPWLSPHDCRPAERWRQKSVALTVVVALGAIEVVSFVG